MKNDLAFFAKLRIKPRARPKEKTGNRAADRRYGRSLFCRENGGLPLGELKKDAGAYGEYLLYDALRREKGKWLFRLCLPHKEEFTEIDALLISGRGVFVFESKNLSGRIYGRPAQPDWVQTLKTEKGIRKKRFFNPLLQNAVHLRALQGVCGREVPMYPMVVLGRDSELYTPELKERQKELLNVRDLPKTIRTFKKGALTKERIDELYGLLLPYTAQDEQAMRRHIAEIARKNVSRSRAGNLGKK